MARGAVRSRGLAAGSRDQTRAANSCRAGGREEGRGMAALKLMRAPQKYVQGMAGDVTPDELYDAIVLADALGQQALGSTTEGC